MVSAVTSIVLDIFIFFSIIYLSWKLRKKKRQVKSLQQQLESHQDDASDESEETPDSNR